MNIFNPKTDNPYDVRILSYYMEDNVDDCGRLLVSANQLQETIKYYEEMGYEVTVDKMKLRITSIGYHLK